MMSLLRCPHCTGELEPPAYQAIQPCLRCHAPWASFKDGADFLLNQTPTDSPAQRTNLLPAVARGYELWRERSLSILTGRSFPLASELALIRHIAPPEGDCLDIGCSTGVYARGVASAAIRSITAVDLSAAMLTEARRRWPADMTLRPYWIRARAQALPIADASIDRIYSGGVLNEIGDEAGSFAEVRRVLRPGGVALIMSLGPAATLHGRAGQALAGLGGIRFFDRAAIEHLALAAGLAIGSWETFGAVAFTRLERR